MFKRFFWLMMGTGFGFGLSLWVRRVVRRTVARFTPERVSNELTTAVRTLGTDLRAAATEGREAMREREIELRAELQRRSGTVTSQWAGEAPAPALSGIEFRSR